MVLLVISLSVAAPKIARSIQRDRDLETFHRGMQYRRAVQLYYRKFHAYPPNVEALVNTNDIRFLRKKYKDPITGQDDWKPIAFGQNKTPTAMGFFGQPLAGNASTLAGIGPGGAGGLPGATTPGGGFSTGSPSSPGSIFGPSSDTGNGQSPSTGTPGTTEHRQLWHTRINPRRHFIDRHRNRHQLKSRQPNLRRRRHHRLLACQPQCLDSRLQEKATLQRVGVHLRPALRHANRRRRQHRPHRPARQQHHHTGGRPNLRPQPERSRLEPQAPTPCLRKPPRSSPQ